MQGAGYEEVRVVASSMLEGYLNNPVHLRQAKALLDRILQHTRGSSDNDLNTVANLLSLRITTMQPPGQVCTIMLSTLKIQLNSCVPQCIMVSVSRLAKVVLLQTSGFDENENFIVQ